ncbi:bifunctional UDP-N-acetylglucosamine diphosphorylase/glucosamine-1-phosphate N-acetyltransferase GlmU [Candidatus Palibaumannia cicadellinicola]|uniref:Bifunctional protein GlmU n=1 Tax=Candidatus Palibaumannia cicadellinicola TaxID=186490 RepID=A0A0K2BKJ7_9GAMM|nr:bifunctional UDP-N-acetylglucosamine diphosphorylase/glucosamine-1-phosphate N-acetyltransferase GlmU [Candidatus Baumannia cicadellinicola]AKZ65737.1 N-acetylglucosamine-1-phosphate uridyltransferase / Glucosamine-1-phosphate N-acetyltransferase [Candidatus Baumannia cicadellinicola]
MLNKSLSIIILAAGNGKRMNSTLPKVLHHLAGKPMVQHVIDTAMQLNANRTYLVYGNNSLLFKEHLIIQPSTIHWVKQQEKYGTGHAVQQVLPFLQDNEEVLILYGDVPLISLKTLKRLLNIRPKSGISILIAKVDNPDGYGRILSKNGKITGIIEHQDANEQQKLINEIHTGILVTTSSDLKHWICQLKNNNFLKEFYLTDIIKLACQEGKKINFVYPERLSEIKGVNNYLELNILERIFQKEQADNLLLEGVMLADPNRFELRGELTHGNDIFIDTNVIIEGKVTIGNKVIIGTGCILKNVVISNNVVIHPYTIIENAYLAMESIVGPFANIRSGSKILKGAFVGNFVEIKKSILGKRSKVAHLSYLGDATIGKKVNIGAGTITCNYDGANKHKTIIEDDVFIGSDCQLVAPITIGNSATIGAGTTVTSDVASNQMIISRIRQFPIINWQRPVK